MGSRQAARAAGRPGGRPAPRPNTRVSLPCLGSRQAARAAARNGLPFPLALLVTQLPRVQVLLAIRILVEFRSAVFGRFPDAAILAGLFPWISGDFGIHRRSYSALRNHRIRRKLAVQYGQVREPPEHWRRKRSETQRAIALATAGRFGRGVRLARQRKFFGGQS